LITEGTFFRHTARTALNIRFAPFRHSRVIASEGFPVEGAGIVRTGNHAVTAANAFVVIHHHDAIIPVVAGSHRADFHAGSVLTLHARTRQVDHLAIHIADFQDFVPIQIRVDVVVGMAD
jgi:hypothetical protein